jgi:hypothetical protein
MFSRRPVVELLTGLMFVGIGVAITAIGVVAKGDWTLVVAGLGVVVSGIVWVGVMTAGDG